VTRTSAGGRGPSKRMVLLIMATVALLVATFGTGGILAADPPSGEAIYFANMSTGTAMAVRPDGTGLTTIGCGADLTHQGPPRRVVALELAGGSFPIVSGTGWWSQAEMRVVSRADDCSDPVVLWDPGTGYVLHGAVWSIDGSRIAVSGSHFDARGQMIEQGIWVAEVGGSCGQPLCGLHLAVTLPMVASAQRDDGLIAYVDLAVAPSWSPDGRRVVYTRSIDPAASYPTYGIYVGDVGQPGSSTASQDRRVIVAGETRSTFGATFSPVPGSDQIAYTVTTSPKGTVRNDIFVVSSAGGAARQVTTTKTMNALQVLHPAWSPDGRWIAFDGYVSSVNGSVIFKIAADGKTKAIQVVAMKTTLLYMGIWRR
jgi:hypothetical protein